MDGSASVLHSERAGTQPSRSFANRAATEAHTQSQLFEQLLSLSFTVQPPVDKPAAPTQSSSKSADDSPCDCREQDSAPVEDEDEDELSQSTLTALTPACLIENQQKIDPEGKGTEETCAVNSAAETKLCDLPKVAEEAIQTAVSNASMEVEGDVKAGGPEASTEAQVTTATDDLTKPIEASAFEESDSIQRRGKAKNSDESNAAAAVPVEQVVEPTVEAQENAKPNQAQATLGDMAVQNARGEREHPSGNEQRGERREKWFERDASSVTSTALEAANDASAPQPTAELPEPVSAVVASDSQVNSVAAADASPPSTESPGAVSFALPTTPAGVPVGLVTASQGIASTSNSSAATTGAEPNQLGPEAPTRTVGTQSAKADSKDKTEASQLTQQERVRVIQRIARSFNRISAEGGTINLRLHPEHLGSVAVQVKLEGRSMAARLTTETAAAREAIMADLPALRQRLADQGFDVTKFQVDVAGNGADTTFAQTNGDSQSRQYENRSSGSQADYRRLAANRESRMAFARQAPPSAAATAMSGAGIDLQV